MSYTIEKQDGGYVLVRGSGNAVTTGAPHNRSALNFETKKQAQAFRELIDIDTFIEKDKWTPAHFALYETIPAIVRNIDGDLFEIKWYGHNGYDGMMWEAENNIFGKGAHLDEFKAAYDALTDEQKNLIYYAYEA